MPVLTDEQWAQYERDGFLKLGKLLDDDALAQLQQRIDDIMLGKADVNYDRMLMQLDSDSGRYEDAPGQTRGFKEPTLNYRKIQDLEFDPIFLRYMKWPIFRDICERTYGKDTPVACFRAMFMNKPAHRGTMLPWHQDRWTHLDRDPQVTIWTALDPATIENGCVQIVPGSHKTLLNPEHASGFLTKQQGEAIDEKDAIYVELEPGEVALLHNWTLHRSDTNRSDTSRRAFSVCYMDARTQVTGDHHYPVIFGEGELDPENLTAATA